MGQAGTQYRELAFSIGCPIKTKGEQALNKSQQYAADGRRTPFPWLLRRHSKVAAVLSVKFFSPQRRYLFDKGRCWLDFRESFRCLLFSSDAVAAFRARPFFIENRGAL